MNIDFDLEGDEELQLEFEELEEDGTSDAAYRVVSNAEYSVPLEFGRGPIEAPEGSAIPIETDSGTIFRKRVSGHPPYPFFRPAVREAQLDLAVLLRKTIQKTPDMASSTDEFVKWVALGLETQMKRNVTAQATGRSPGTHPEHPKVQTNNLRSRIQSQRIR